MVRTDDEPTGDKPKPAIDEATARRLLNAVADLSERAGITHADEDVKNEVKGGDAPKPDLVGTREDSKRKDDEPSLSDVMTALKGVSDRLTKLEGKQDDDEEPDDLDEGKPEALAADEAKHRRDGFKHRRAAERANAALCEWRHEDKFADFQSRADAVASLFGQRAPKPIAGETLGTFKRRSVRPWQSLSPTYKDVDLRVLGVADSVAFNVAVDDILKCARDEGQRPTRVPLGYLAERIEQKGGHTFTRFFGRPTSWMAQFAPPGKLVRRVNRYDAAGNITGAAYVRAERVG